MKMLSALFLLEHPVAVG